MRPNESEAPSMRRMLVIVFWVLTAASPAWATSDLGNPAVTRLWSDQNELACTGFYIDDPALRETQGATIVTAGHCVKASLARRFPAGSISMHIDWRAMLEGRSIVHRNVDVAIGTGWAPEGPTNRFTLGSDPGLGDRVWVHGFPSGVEGITAATVIPPSPEDPDLVRLQVAEPLKVWLGSSGSPVVNEQGQVVGVVVSLYIPGQLGRHGLASVGLFDFFRDRFRGEVYATPVSVIKALLNLLSRDKEPPWPK